MNKPVKIIFDTDIGGDCDDAGALAMLHRLCDKGEAELLAVTHCMANPYFAGCIDAINRFYGREVPVGLNYEDHRANKDAYVVYAKALCSEFPNRYPAETWGTDKAAPDTLTVLRKTLAEAENHSVTLVVTGYLGSMSRLVFSGPDEISSMSGMELIEKKILRTVIMGGRFFESWPMPIYPAIQPIGEVSTWEWNIHESGLETAQKVFDNWLGELVLSSFEIGLYIHTMKGYPSRAAADDPVARAYQIHNGGAGRCSWDHTAVLEAVRPGIYWNYHEHGRIRVDDEFVTRWVKDDNCRHTYLLPKTDYEEIRQIIDDLVDGK